MEVPSESFHWSSWDSRTCYPRRAFIQGLSDDRFKNPLNYQSSQLSIQTSPMIYFLPAAARIASLDRELAWRAMTSPGILLRLASYHQALREIC